MKDIVIIGAGGVGKETAWIIEQINDIKKEWNIVGFVDDNIEIHNSFINGYKVLGSVDYLLSIKKEIYVICAMANYKIKKMIVGKIGKSTNHKFANIIHPSVYIDRTIKIGNGSIIYPAVIMTTNITIGNHVIISPKTGIGHESIIEDYVSLLWNTNISGNDRLCEGCFIGSGATIIQNRIIGVGSIVGAGAVVIKDVNDDLTVIGCPANIK